MTPDILSQLKSCPLCGGGEFQIRENGRIWIGTRYSDHVSVSIYHWCNESPGIQQPLIERKGKTLEQAIERWNQRA